jgi:hypothetical protein
MERRSRPEEPRRTLKKVDLMEVSIVTMPANPKARVTQVKSGSIREFEAFLRDAGGFSAAQAKAIAASGFKSIEAMRDAGDGQELESRSSASSAPSQERKHHEALRSLCRRLARDHAIATVAVLGFDISRPPLHCSHHLPLYTAPSSARWAPTFRPN